MCQNLEFSQPFKRMLPGCSAHFSRSLQPAAAVGALGLAEYPAAEFGIQMFAGHAGRLGQRRD
jgi:hypothetical protein